MKRITFTLLIAALLATVVGSSACATQSPEKMLEAHVWAVSALGPDQYEGSSAMVLQFTAGKISGSTGVNRFSGTYTTKSGNGITIVPGALTQAAGTPDSMAAESAFLKGLRNTASYAVHDQSLTLFDSSGVSTLKLSAR